MKSIIVAIAIAALTALLIHWLVIEPVKEKFQQRSQQIERLLAQ